MTDKLRALLVGCGNMSRVWFRAIQEIEDLEMVGLVDLVEENAARRAAEYRLQDAMVGVDLETVLESTRPEVVFDCTVPEAHAQVALKALEHGCHVLGEKPLADSMEKARMVVEASERAGRIHAVIQNRRYDPNIRRLRRLLEAGEIGPITTVNSDFYIGAHFGGFRDHMEHVLLLDMAIHTFDAARLLTAADPLSVYCREWNPAGSWYDRDASAVAVFEMTGGIVYTYRGSWCAEGLPTSWESEWRILGAGGTARWDGGDGIAAETVADGGDFHSRMREVEVPSLHAADRVGAHAGLIREFVECVRQGETPETAGSDNIKSLAMVFGAIESAERGRPVDIRW